MNKEIEKLESNNTLEVKKSHANENIIGNEESATRTMALFEADFKIHADRGSNCFKDLDIKN
jgi:hypothetical protein